MHTQLSVYGAAVVCCQEQDRAIRAETPAQEPRVDAEPVDIRETGLRNQACGGGHPITPKYQKLRFLLKHKFSVLVSRVDGHGKACCISSYEHHRGMKSSPAIVKCLENCHL